MGANGETKYTGSSIEGGLDDIRVMHVLHNMEVGGVQKLALDLIDNLPEISSSVVAVITGGEHQSDFEQRCPTTVVGDNPNDPHYSYRWFSPPTVLRVMKAIKENRPNIVQTHTFPAAVVGRTAAKLAGVPVIVDSLHNTYTWKQPRELNIDRFLSHVTDRIVCDSDAVRKYAIKQNPHIPKDKYTRIHLGVDTDRYKFRDNGVETRARFGLSADDVVIGAMGRLVPQKRMGDLVSAGPEILRRFPEARFLMVGDGQLKEQLLGQVRAAGLEHAFRFVGTIMDNENIYPACDIFCQLAEREGFGLSMVEAMASRTPLVAASAPPVKEIVRHDYNGIVYEPGDIKGLVDSIDLLLRNKEKAKNVALHAEEDARRFFSIPASAKNHRALYEELLLGRR